MHLKNCAKYHKIAAFGSGFLAKYCFSNLNSFCLIILLFVSWAILKILEFEKKNTFLVGFCFGLGFFIGTLSWLAKSFSFVGLEAYGYPAVVALSCYLALFPALACWLCVKMQKSKVTQMLFFSIFWVIFEYIRGIAFSGFPWNLVGYAAMDIKYFCQIADIVGIYGVSFIFMLILTFGTCKKTIGYSVGIFILTIFYGYYRVELSHDYKTHSCENEVGIVRSCVLQAEKMKSNYLRYYIAQTKLCNSDAQNNRLIVWPESVVDLVFEQENVVDFLRLNLLNDEKISLIAGADRVENGKLYNSILLMNKNSQELIFYDKRHLLPFGEFMPDFFANLGLASITSGSMNFSKGQRTRSVLIDGFDQFDVLICYEIVFPSEILDSARSAWILNITNDAWFENTDGPFQHFKTVRMRAIEEGRPIVRCANCGISGFVDCNGFLTNADSRGFAPIVGGVPKKYRDTIYSKYQNKPFFVMIGGFFIFAIILRRKRVIEAL